MRTVVMFLGVLVIAGCASSPEEIGASYVSPVQYSKYTCEQISMERERTSSELQIAANAQDKRQKNDTILTGVGIVLFWPALFFIKGDGAHATEVSRLKGEDAALDKAYIQNGCNTPRPVEAGATIEE